MWFWKRWILINVWVCGWGKLTFRTVMSFETALTMAFAFNTTSMPRAPRHLTFSCWDFTFSTFVTFFTMAQTSTIVAMTRAQNRTNACIGENDKNLINMSKIQLTSTETETHTKKNFLFDTDMLCASERNMMCVRLFFLFILKCEKNQKL